MRGFKNLLNDVHKLSIKTQMCARACVCVVFNVCFVAGGKKDVLNCKGSKCGCRGSNTFCCIEVVCFTALARTFVINHLRSCTNNQISDLDTWN